MEEVNQLTKITICWELFEAGVPKSHIAQKLDLNRETVHLWIKGILELGLLEFLDKYTKSKKGEKTN
jgi:transposase-like protein